MHSSESEHAVQADPRPNKKQPEAITPVIAMRNLGYARYRLQRYGRAMERTRRAFQTQLTVTLIKAHGLGRQTSINSAALPKVAWSAKDNLGTCSGFRKPIRPVTNTQGVTL
jgi:hypothetical protein